MMIKPSQWCALLYLYFLCACSENISPSVTSTPVPDLSMAIDAYLDVFTDQPIDFEVHPLDQSISVDRGGDSSDSSILLDSELTPWERNECTLSSTPLNQEELDIDSQEVRAVKNIGGPLGKHQLLIQATANEDEKYHFISLRGGDLALRNNEGQIEWQSSDSSLKSLHGLYDFDGDGSLEILVTSTLRAHIFNLSNGQELWRSSPEDLGGESRFSSIATLKVSQNSDELYPYLYLADAGCSTAGTGYGVIYHFAEGFNHPSQQVISGPRLAGRCAKWHSLFRQSSVTSQDELYILITDQNGLHAFSSHTGERVICGHYHRELTLGRLPYTLINAHNPSWISITDDEVSLLTQRPWQPHDIHCQEQEQVLAPTWTRNLHGATPTGLYHIELTGDDKDEIWVNHLSSSSPSTPTSEWMVSLLDGSDGSTLATISGLSILGQISWKIMPSGEVFLDLLVALNASPDWPLADVASTIQAIRINLSELNHHLNEDQVPFEVDYEFLWPNNLENVVPLWQKNQEASTSEFKNLELIQGQAGQSILLRRFPYSSPEQLDQHELLSVNLDGTSSTLTSSYDWGLVKSICSKQSGCIQSNRIVVTENIGDILVYDSSLTKTAPQDEITLSLVAGRLAYNVYLSPQTEQSRLVTTSSSGVLSVFSLPNRSSIYRSQTEAIWRKPITNFTQPGTITPHTPYISSTGVDPLVLVYDNRTPNQSDWIAYRLDTGEVAWTHSLPTPLWRTEKQYQIKEVIISHQRKELLFRLERALSPAALAELSPCEGDENYYANQNLFENSLACPNVMMTPRVIHALDVQTGECIWRTIIEEHNPCIMPALQYLNFADINDDGFEELYLFETDSLRELDPATGELLKTAILPLRPDGRFVGGGWLKPYHSGLLRFGTYSPPDLYRVFTDDEQVLTPIWFGNSDLELRNQSWLLRWAAVTSHGAWISTGLNKPLARYNRLGEMDRLIQLSVNTTGQPLVTPLSLDTTVLETANIDSLTESDSDGIIATTDDGGLFILNGDGELQWSRAFSSAPSSPLFIDWDQDGTQEWLISTSDGELFFFDQQIYSGVIEVWESSCDIPATCSISEDIDRHQIDHPLCVAWIPMTDTEGAVIQLQTMNGTGLSTWQEAGVNGRIRLDQLRVIAGQQYKISIRAWFYDENGEKVYTEPSYSDGFTVIGDQSPTVSLTLDQSQLNLHDEATLHIQAVAEDIEALAGWSLVIYSEQNTFIKVLSSGSTNEQSIVIEETWDGTDRYERSITPGRYRVFFAATDRAGQQSNTMVWVEVN